MSFFTGTPGRYEQRFALGKEQKPLYQQAVNAGLRPGAGGAFGNAADYYRGLLEDNNSTYNALEAPELRQFNEQIVPGLSEQFAGMGFGGSGLNSSGFRNAAVNAGTDLSERLGAIRAQLRQQGAQGLMNIGHQGLQQFHENIYRPPTEGFLGSALGPALGAVATGFGGPVLGALGAQAGSWLSNKFKRNTSPYGQDKGLANSGNYGPAF